MKWPNFICVIWVGGHYGGDQNEILYRFQFPERRGALADFLAKLSPHWNISLFHYRNHGTDYGRVLVGLEVAPQEVKRFRKSLDELGYRYWDETDNAAFGLFLS